MKKLSVVGNEIASVTLYKNYNLIKLKLKYKI